MFKQFGRFFSPGTNSPLWIRIMPYATLAFAAVVAFGIAGAGWEYTNSSEFCGTTCHTMPPQYLSYLHSPHANVKCVECHIGRATIATQFTRKAHDISHVVKFIGADYETPIYIKSLRPAEEVCEKCHNPSSFSNDSIKQIRSFDAEKNNEETLVNLAFRIGGGTHREGRGKGIHWHIENDVEYIATDDPHLQQEIPWVRVTYAETGEVEEFVDVDADLPADFVEHNADKIQTMDCVSCHNRVSHIFSTPDEALNDAMDRGIIDPSIPYFKQNAMAIMERQYPNMDEARHAIQGLSGYYQVNWPDYYEDNTDKVDAAVDEMLVLYERMVFPTMDASWTSHPDNLGHKDWAGCFRCHDGKHINEAQESIRIECNLCHSIPETSPLDGSTPVVKIQDTYEPESHIDSNWTSRHRFEFDGTCQGCHDVSNPGGSDDSSFCANSSCHATDWEHAGLDAMRIIELTNVLNGTLPTYPEAPLTWDDLVGPILEARCVACHGGTAGLYLDSYEGAMAGGNLGPAIVPGDAENSALVQLQREGHPNSLAPRELEWVIEWIDAGAPESEAPAPQAAAETTATNQ
jgi:nitrate/TMAO reductase-like tetraheme cytochrome c subunit